MHDPSVLLTDIDGIPLSVRTFKRWRKHGFRPVLIEVWHDEPNGADSGSVCARDDRWKHWRHLRIKFIPWVELRHRFVRCEECGRRMNLAERHGYMSSDRVWHQECMSLGAYRNNVKLVNEVLHRVATSLELDTQEKWRALVVDPNETRDQFLLWDDTWRRIVWYRQAELEDKWRAPNEQAHQPKDKHHDR